MLWRTEGYDCNIYLQFFKTLHLRGHHAAGWMNCKPLLHLGPHAFQSNCMEQNLKHCTIVLVGFHCELVYLLFWDNIFNFKKRLYEQLRQYYKNNKLGVVIEWLIPDEQKNSRLQKHFDSVINGGRGVKLCF